MTRNVQTPTASAARLVRALAAAIGAAAQQRRLRAAAVRLQALDDRALKDMGIYRSGINSAVRNGVGRPEGRYL